MGEQIYTPLLEDMTWSYSRIKSFDDCPYGFYMKYISKEAESPMFYSSYGKLMHSLLEQYYIGMISKEEMLERYLTGFKESVIGDRPQESTVQKYVQSGIDYLTGFTPLPYKVLDIEKKVSFKIGKYDFVGIVDYIGEDENGNIVIVDNKSRDLKQRSNRKKPTQNDLEIDEMLNQLYIYSKAVECLYGKLPSLLCFNCFRTSTLISENFDLKAYNSSLEWAEKAIDSIITCDEFYPMTDFFKCKYICGFHDDCCYWMNK